MPPKTREKRANMASGATPAPVPPGAGGAAAAAAAEKPAKRARIARKLGPAEQQMIINCFNAVQADTTRTGKTAENVAALLGIANGTVKKVMSEHRQRSDAAFAAGAPADSVRPPPAEPETREREPKVKDRHVDFVLRCLSKQMFEEELDELPSLQSMYEYAIGERVEAAKLRH